MEKIYDLQEFMETILEIVREKAAGVFSVRLTKNQKNNGVEKLAVAIKSKEELVESCVYLEDIFTEYLDGRLGLEAVAEGVYRILTEAQKNKPDINTAELLQWEKMKPLIRPVLINTEMNCELLKEVPYRLFLDMSVTYYIAIKDKNMGNGAIRIRNEHLSAWGQDEEALYQTACKNREMLEEPEFIPINELLSSGNMSEPYTAAEPPCMFILTNKDRYLGAAEMMYHDTLRKISKEIGDFVILPSSLHEVVILPDNGKASYDSLADMVKNINSEHVCLEERLSDHVYVYSKEKDQLQIAA